MSARSLQAKQARAARWDAEFINCTLHPDRRCNRSDYIHTGSRRCASCKAWHRATPSAREKRRLLSVYPELKGESLRAAALIKLNAKAIGAINSFSKPATSLAEVKINAKEFKAKGRQP